MPEEFGMAAETAAWEQSISSLSDSKFFEIVRLYLGEVETRDGIVVPDCGVTQQEE